MNIATFTSKRFLVRGLLLLILIVLAALPLYGPLVGVSNLDLYIPATTFMYIALAVSWAMFSGPTGYLSLAPAAFFGVGIYTTAILRGDFGLPLGVTIPVACVISFLVALLVGMATLRLKGIYFAIFTFGLVVLIGQLVLYYEIHILGIRGRNVPPATYETFYLIMLGLAVAAVLTAYFIRRSRLGLAMQSIGGNEEAAAHMGVNTTMVKVLTFAISAFFMGAAGAIMATKWIYVDPTVAFNMFYSFMPVLMAVFGGMGQLYGPVIGAAIFAYTERTLRLEFSYYYMLAFGIILILVILFLPGGLVGLIPKLWNRLRGPISKLWKGGKAEQHANT